MSFRIGGMVTGLDTQGLVEQLLQLERRPILNLQARAKELQSRQGAWQGIGKRLAEMEATLARLAAPSTYTSLETVSDSEDITASIDGTASQGHWQVQVERLAEARVIASSQFDLAGPGDFSLNGVTVSLSETTDIHGLAKAINEAGKASYSFLADSQGQIEVSGTYLGKEDVSLLVEVQGRDLHIYDSGNLVQTFSDALDSSGTGSIVFEGLNIQMVEAQSGDSVEIQACAEKKSGVSASVVDGHLVLKAETHDPIDFLDSQGVLEQIGVLDAQGNEKNVLTEGCTALLRIDGLLVERDSNIIEDAIHGVRLDLHKAGNGVINFRVTRDNQHIIEGLQKFVEQHNALKNALKAENSLQGDNMAMRLQNSLWQTINSTGAGEFKSLQDLGVSGIGRTGLLELNMDKLEQALTNPSAVRELLIGETGLVGGIRSFVQQWSDTRGLIKTRLDTYQVQIKTNESSILRAEQRLELKEEQLWRQFTAMEKALSTLYSQSEWLAGQLNSLPGYSQSKG